MADKIGQEIFYDYRDDQNLKAQIAEKAVMWWQPLHFSDEFYNSIWTLYRPPQNKTMDQQLDEFYITPMADRHCERKDGRANIFQAGIPMHILKSFAEFWVQHPLLKIERKNYENCKLMKQNPNLCVSESVAVAEAYNKVAEQPFTKCPKESVGWVKCVDDNARNFFMCRDLQVEWEDCMKSHFNLKFPPYPKHPRRAEWNAGSEDPYRMRFKLRSRDMWADLSRHTGVGTVHPDSDIYADNF
eukprot:TRINITY_DN22551_c0_g1_i1.p2 TRINITY_DN22551_c0_g1~~TRINITY_DN22551_c0_g1_i1.p2  ORF type:complete len:243 (+),score=86.01 TRINITY_DN22551_c0_g1_i1:66-794(+)